MLTRSRRAFARLVDPSVVATGALIVCMLAPCGVAQVRMNLRAGMQIDSLAPGQASLDERFWPLEVNAFASGDVDADGDLDLVAAVNQGPGVLWRNDGGGAFTRSTSLPTSGSRCCSLFDVDGDNDLDAFFAGGGTSYGGATPCTLLRNDGSGNFTPSPTLPSSGNAVYTISVGIGDLDGDGDRDIVLFANIAMLCWRNDGSGTFTDHTAAALAPGTLGAPGMLVDVEPDGDLDIVAEGIPSTWQLYRNDGHAVFTSEAWGATPIPVPHRAEADVDGDLLIDDIGIAANVPYLRRNLGGGVYQDVTAAWFGPHALVDRTIGHAHAACAVFDADGDGDLDFVTGGSDWVNLSSTTVGVPPTLFVNADRQRFVDGGRPALPQLHAMAQSLAAGDVNGDGRVDLVISSGGPFANGNTVWLQDAAGRFDPAGTITPAVAGGTYVHALSDVDGDGDLDVIAVHGAGQELPGFVGQHRLHRNDGGGNFTDVTATHMPSTAVSGGASCTIGDVDGDGDADVVIGSYEPGFSGPGVPLMLLRNDSSGVFTHATAAMPATPYDAGFAALRDFDGDGDRDLVVALDLYRSGFGWPAPMPPILFFANDGTGSFTDETGTRMPVTPPGYGLSVLDLDGDQDLDIAQSNVNLLNDGAGVFIAAAAAANRVLVADLDEDGAPDDVREVVGSNGTPTRIHTNGGRTLFEHRGAHGHLVLPVDLDRDGDLDLVVATSNLQASPWDVLRVGTVYNLRRDLRVATLPRIGADYTVQLRATNGTAATLAVVAVATATLPQAIMIPGWGLLQLDPSQMSVFATALIPDADTMVEVSMAIPNAPTLFGLPLSCQALFIPIGNEAAMHLSNAMTFPLER